jgi:hypothetical protein
MVSMARFLKIIEMMQQIQIVALNRIDAHDHVTTAKSLKLASKKMFGARMGETQSIPTLFKDAFADIPRLFSGLQALLKCLVAGAR